MPTKASDLPGLRRVCKAKPLIGAELQEFFIETDRARNPQQHTRQRLKMVLNESEDVRILFYGHRGCGKSTELNKLLDELGGAFLKVQFSVEEHMNMTAAYAEDLLLLICERLLATAKDAGNKLDNEALKGIYDYFAKTVQETSSSRDAKLAVEAGAQAGLPLLDKLLGLFGKFSSELRFNAHSAETTVATLRKRPGDLVVQVNILIDIVRQSLPPKQRLLIVVEDLDKLDLERARPIFVDNIGLLAQIKTNIIYTIPVFIFHSPDVSAITPHFDATIGLPMIKVCEPGGTEFSEGHDVIKDIILSRLEPDLLTCAAMDLLIQQTGGVLRHVFEVLHTASTMAEAPIPLDTQQIEYGLQQLKNQLWMQVSLPHDKLPNGPTDIEQLYERLVKIARSQQAGEYPPLQADAINQILLRSCSLVQYNGRGWLGVHPLIRDYLRQMGRL